ncbi:MAG: 3'-5' exonuclease [Planctomycetes bacterium]|nr:3'-5' exonuclease [Planctomycetota bacterium]
MYLFFDTETTGIPRNYKAPPSDLANWPRIVQLAWVVADEGGGELKSVERIIRPDGFTIPESAAQIHGITTEIATRDGVDLRLALDEIESDMSKAAGLFAHNMSFDENILGAEFLRAGRPNILLGKSRGCTMVSSTHFCNIPGPYGPKWPKLQELHTKLFGESFEGGHDALIDVRACAKCYFELRRLGQMQ